MLEINQNNLQYDISYGHLLPSTIPVKRETVLRNTYNVGFKKNKMILSFMPVLLIISHIVDIANNTKRGVIELKK